MDWSHGALEVHAAGLPEGQRVDGEPFPLLLTCRTSASTPAEVGRWIEWARGAVEGALRHTGAILFRGFPIADALAFDAFVAGFGFTNFRYDESLSNAVRKNVTERVFTANEAPPSATIRLHHEMAQTPIHPSRLFFFCEEPASQGGATSLCRSDLLLEALAERCPALLRECETKGLRYTNVMPPDDDAQSGLGRSWRRTFGADTRDGAEARMRALGYGWVWLQGDCLRVSTPVLPAVRALHGGRRSFFNQLIAALAWQDQRNEASKAVTFGDGSPVDPGDAATAGEIAEALTFDLSWQRGDVALVDNHRVMHGRRSFSGRRRVLASLVAADA